jgi:flagellum-specific ATP synthase
MPPETAEVPDLLGAAKLVASLRSLNMVRRVGRVVRVVGQIIESQGPNVALGEVCTIRSHAGEAPIQAEVVGFRDHHIQLMPLGSMPRLRPGSEVTGADGAAAVPTGSALCGRVLDGLGRPIDGRGPLPSSRRRPLRATAPDPLKRRRIREPFATGIRAVDLFTPVGRGQRMGIFAGSGVGKSTLLGMMARSAASEVNVIALIGERGRELRDFIEGDLGAEGLARSVIVCATSDQPAPLRVRAALLATAIAEEFRDAGREVLFMMDSVTRFAMAQREIGLAVGEPPSSRGYTPSVFAALPQLLERTGAGERGSITAFYTVLVEGDDMNEPVTDAVRGILDGHLVLSRALAAANRFPAIDVLESLSRLIRDLSTPEELANASEARDLLALYRKNEDLITLGSYAAGTNKRLDRAVALHEPINQLLRQRVDEAAPRAASLQQLAALLRS